MFWKITFKDIETSLNICEKSYDTNHYLMILHRFSGNVLGFQPYKSGQPACGNYGMSYSNRYAGLCC